MLRRNLLAGLFIAPTIIPSTNLMKLSWRSSSLLLDPQRIFLYDINSSKECQEKTGKFIPKGEIMQGLFLSKEDFYPDGNPFNFGKWHIEVVDSMARREREIPGRSGVLSPYHIYQYYNGSGSFAAHVKVYAVKGG